MNVSGLLDLFDQIPAFTQLVGALSDAEAQPLLPLDLPRGARAPVVAQLYRRLSAPARAPILLLCGRVDTATLWRLKAWFRPGLPSPTIRNRSLRSTASTSMTLPPSCPVRRRSTVPTAGSDRDES